MKPEILKIQEVMLPAPNNQLVKGVRVTFNVGVHGPFTKEFKQEGLKGLDIKNELDSWVRELQSAGLV